MQPNNHDPPAAGVCARVRVPLLAAALILCFLAPAASAQRLANQRYDVRDGLAHDRVTSIYQDPHGYLWFGTWEGLSRFDGYEFHNTGIRDGLSPPIVFGIDEDARGDLWLATWGGGVAHLIVDPERMPRAAAGEQRRRVHVLAIGPERKENNVQSLVFAPDGSLLCLTEVGLYRGRPAGIGDSLAFEPVPVGNEGAQTAHRSADGTVWLGIGSTLCRFEGGSIVPVEPPQPRQPPGDERRPERIVAIDEGKSGEIVVARVTTVDLYRPGSAGAAPSSAAGIPGSWTRLPLPEDPDRRIRAIEVNRDGVVWVGTENGLWRCDGTESRLLTTEDGLADDFVRALFEDREGNLWIATNQSGVTRLADPRIVSFPVHGASVQPSTPLLVESLDGGIYATTEGQGVLRVEGNRAAVVPGSEAPLFRSLHRRLAQGTDGAWWIGTDRGLYRAPGPELRFDAARKVPASSGLPGDAQIVGVAFDRPTRRLVIGASDEVLYDAIVPDGALPRFRSYRAGEEAGIEGLRLFLAAPGGDLWIAAFAGLARLRDGRLERIFPQSGLPSDQTRPLFLDSRSRLWLGHRFGGVSVTDDPQAGHPVFRNYSEEDGLSSATVWAIAEDDSGRIYLGTSRGLDRLDPDTGTVQHYGVSDGLAGDSVNDALRDREGRIWLGTSGGISRFDPSLPEPAPLPPPIYLSSVQAGGEDLFLPDHGLVALEGIRIGPRPANLEVSFVGLSFRGERTLRYSYRLEGDPMSEEWSAPTAQRTVLFSRLMPGRYRFEVRAITRQGIESPLPARVELEVLPPLWRQAWFLGLLVAAGLAAVYGWHRVRIRQAVAMERIRRQIATDLHDDIGSGLSEIAVLSEVAKRDATPEGLPLLDQTAGLARSMRESMADIVWSVDPRRDSLVDLVRRMRQAASNLLEVNGVAVEFLAPAAEAIESVPMAPDRRRHLLLLYKEALANIARHAGASRVAIRISTGDGSRLMLEIEDDGRGFDPAAGHDGHGLASMRQRAEEMAALLAIDSRPGGGSRIRFESPLPGRGVSRLAGRLHRMRLRPRLTLPVLRSRIPDRLASGPPRERPSRFAPLARRAFRLPLRVRPPLSSLHDHAARDDDRDRSKMAPDRQGR